MEHTTSADWRKPLWGHLVAQYPFISSYMTHSLTQVKRQPQQQHLFLIMPQLQYFNPSTVCHTSIILDVHFNLWMYIGYSSFQLIRDSLLVQFHKGVYKTLCFVICVLCHQLLESYKGLCIYANVLCSMESHWCIVLSLYKILSKDFIQFKWRNVHKKLRIHIWSYFIKFLWG